MSLRKRRKFNIPILMTTGVLGGGGTLTAVQPDALSGLLAWWDFSDTTTLFQDTAGTTPADNDTEPIGRVNDKSSSGINPQQGTAANRPLNKANAKNSLTAALFDGSNDSLRSTSFTDTNNQITVFAVARYDTTGPLSQAILEISAGTTNTGYLLFHDSGGGGKSYWSMISSASNGTPALISARDNTWHIHCGLQSGLNLSYYIDGALQGTKVAASLNTANLTQIDIGVLATVPSYILKGNVGEVIIYNRQVTDVERQRLDLYLSAKWDIGIT